MATNGSWNNGGTSSPVVRTNIWGTQSYTLSANEVWGSLFNLLIESRTFVDNIKGGYNSLQERTRIQGGLYGDFITKKGTDVLESKPFTDPYAYSTDGNFQGNLLKTAKPKAPKEEYLQIDQVRFIELSLDMFLSKRLFADEGSFSEFHSSMLNWMQDTKKIYYSGLVNTFIGNKISTATKGTINIDVTSARNSASSEEEANRLEAQTIARDIADLLVDVKDYSRDYNEWGLLRAVDPSDLLFVWNSKYKNRILKIDLPTIYNKDGVMERMDEEMLPPRFFGRALTEDDFGSGKVIGTDGAYDSTKGTLRAAKEFTYNDVHYFQGDALATTGTYVGVVGGLEATDVYLQVDDVICKVMHKSSVAWMGAYESQESFYNQRSKVTNFYLHFMFSNPVAWKNYPFLTIKKV